MNAAREEVNQLLWNTARLAGCQFKRTALGIQNRGYGQCSVTIHQESQVVQRILHPVSSIANQLIPAVDSLEMDSVRIRWNAAASQSIYQWREPATEAPTRNPLSVAITETPPVETEEIALSVLDKHVIPSTSFLHSYLLPIQVVLL